MTKGKNMLIVKRIKKESNGSFTTTWALDEEEMGYLLTYAINSLLQEGLIRVEEIEENSPEQLELDLQTQETKGTA